MSRKIVDEVLTPRIAKELWPAGYRPALPIVPQNFALGSVLPAVLYMMRWGHRRGQGQFAKVYGTKAKIIEVAERLAGCEGLVGFEGEVEQAILGDMLLAFCLENQQHLPGRDQPVQRVFPTHYYSSWVDLPLRVAHLRSVPEMIVALLAQQPSGATLSHRGGGHFPVGTGFDKNRMLSLFGPGTSVRGSTESNLKSDHFDDEVGIGVDQLLMVRLALSLGERPRKAVGEKPEIPNQLPVAQIAAHQFYEDINVFLRAYGDLVPRQSLAPTLESALAVGLTNVYLSTLRILLDWADTGTVLSPQEPHPWPLFLDCSVSQDRELRRLSEESLDDLLHRLARLPVIMMCLTLLEQRARDEGIKPPPEPDPTAWINFLGELLHERCEASRDIMRDIRKDCNRLADALEEKAEADIAGVLRNEAVASAWRLAEGLVLLKGQRVQFQRFNQFLDGCLYIDQPNGLARKRQSTVGKGKRCERRSLVPTNTVLDFLVHRHLRKARKGARPAPLSLDGFIRVLKECYGFHVSEAPPGMAIPADLLRRNRATLERRLRDLGLLIGVNDAESMKRLRPRFKEGNNYD